MNEHTAKVGRISAIELSRLQNTESLDLLDVRSVEEYRSARVAGARLVPIDTLTPDNALVSPGRPVYVICQSGHRSLLACRMLAKSGIDAINVDGGIMAWAQAGLPIQQDTGTLRITR